MHLFIFLVVPGLALGRSIDLTGRTPSKRSIDAVLKYSEPIGNETGTCVVDYPCLGCPTSRIIDDPSHGQRLDFMPAAKQGINALELRISVHRNGSFIEINHAGHLYPVSQVGVWEGLSLPRYAQFWAIVHDPSAESGDTIPEKTLSSRTKDGREQWELSYHYSLIDRNYCNLDSGAEACIRFEITHLWHEGTQNIITLDALDQPSMYFGIQRSAEDSLYLERALLANDRSAPPPSLIGRPVVTFKPFEWDQYGRYGTVRRLVNILWHYLGVILQGIAIINDMFDWRPLLIIVPICSPVAVLVYLAKRRYDRDRAEADAYVAQFEADSPLHGYHDVDDDLLDMNNESAENQKKRQLRLLVEAV